MAPIPGQSTRGEASPRVLVVTYPLDPTADYVLAELNSRGVPFWRTDLADFPTRSTLHAELRPDGRWAGSWHSLARGVGLSELRAVWWRKPAGHEFAETMSSPEPRPAPAHCGASSKTHTRSTRRRASPGPTGTASPSTLTANECGWTHPTGRAGPWTADRIHLGRSARGEPTWDTTNAPADRAS
ncbi:MvdC/MvdD family ATP grasp protein [Streptomyces sp. NPDC000410]|uniref:MvdC/MvdD family ATP grasp protein n=1 Tax=Streptomyces sp. NPDC000410 TaxID=3154254 RepID=UPI00331BE7CA